MEKDKKIFFEIIVIFLCIALLFAFLNEFEKVYDSNLNQFNNEKVYELYTNKADSSYNENTPPIKVAPKKETLKEKREREKQEKLSREQNDKYYMRIAFCNSLNESLSLYDVDVKIVTPRCVKLMISGNKDIIISIAAEIKNSATTMRRLRELGFEEIYFTNMWGYGYHLYI